MLILCLSYFITAVLRKPMPQILLLKNRILLSMYLEKLTSASKVRVNSHNMYVIDYLKFELHKCRCHQFRLTLFNIHFLLTLVQNINWVLDRNGIYYSLARIGWYQLAWPVLNKCNLECFILYKENNKSTFHFIAFDL